MDHLPGAEPVIPVTQQMQPQGGQQSMGQMAPSLNASLQEVETPEQRQAMEDIGRSMQVCGWCAYQCIQMGDPNMSECIRRCLDVVELGEAAMALAPINSRYKTTALQAFQQAAQACAQECSHHTTNHCQECAQVLDRTATSISQFLNSPAATGQQPTTYQ